MNHSRRWWFLIVLLIGVAMSIFYQYALLDYIGDLVERGRRATFGDLKKTPALVPTVKQAIFYMSPRSEKLLRVERDIEEGNTSIKTVRRTLESLIAGPREEDAAVPVVPPGVKIRAIFPGPGSTLYIDFDRKFREAHPGGAWSELLSVQAVANTVLANYGNVYEKVILLIEGQQAETIAGALTIAGPLKFRNDLVEAPAAEAAPEAAPETAAPVVPPTPPAPVGVPDAPVSPAGVSDKASPVGVPSKDKPVGPVGAPKGDR